MREKFSKDYAGRNCDINAAVENRWTLDQVFAILMLSIAIFSSIEAILGSCNLEVFQIEL